ncbi:MAG: hypothetical protein AAF675_00565 [Pseudomonadota bacterium]
MLRQPDGTLDPTPQGTTETTPGRAATARTQTAALSQRKAEPMRQQQPLLRALAAAVLSLVTALPAAAHDPKPALQSSKTLDCTFFRSQAFNQADDHYTARMEKLCTMLSDYKSAVIDQNTRHFLESRDARPSAPTRAADRVAEIPSSSDAGKYLIAREIGLIDAMDGLAQTEADSQP